MYANIYRDFWPNIDNDTGYSFEWFWPIVIYNWMPENVMASTTTFDHFVRTAARPEIGGHYADTRGGKVLFRAAADSLTYEVSEDDAFTWDLLIPNAGSGAPPNLDGNYFGNIGFYGKIVENRLCDGCGEYDADFTMNCGSYYDKLNAAYLMAESVDNFISDSRMDFVDGRYRAVSLADLFPNGYRRWLANSLTNDEALKGPQLAAYGASEVIRALSNHCTAMITQCVPDDLGNDPCCPSSFACQYDCEACCENTVGAAGSNIIYNGPDDITCECLGGPILAEEHTGEMGTMEFYRSGATYPVTVELELVNRWPAYPLGWVSWWNADPAVGPQVCFANSNTQSCGAYKRPDGGTYGGFAKDPTFPTYGATAPAATNAMESQVGWDQQKFLINWTMLYLMENERQQWINQLRLWELGVDADPGFANRIEFHDPWGKTFVALTFGKETLFGQQVQKGIAARVLEYANSLLAQAFYTTDGPDLDGDGDPDWYIPTIDTDGQPKVRAELTGECPGGICPCSMNSACLELERYVTIPYYLRETMDAYGLIDPEQEGLFDY